MECPKCKSEIDENSEYCSECGYNLKKDNSHFTISKKLVFGIVIIIIIIIGIITISSFTGNNVLNGVVDTVSVENVSVSEWNNDFWDDEDKIVYITFKPLVDLENESVYYDETFITYSDGSSEELTSIVGEWNYQTMFTAGESYTFGVAFESHGKTPTHISGKLVTFVGENRTEKVIIGHFDKEL